MADQNWAKTFNYRAAKLVEPATVAELREAVRASELVKPLGSRHSFSKIADTKGTLISMARFTEVEEVDKSAMTVTVGGGVKYGDLAQKLEAQGYALHNLASLPHISVAGAIATGTHGSGSGNGNLSTEVEGLEIVTASGELRQHSRASDGERFDGMVVGLGALGFTTKVTLRVQPTYAVKQYVFEHMPWEQVFRNFDAVMNAGYSVSLFTTCGEDGIEEVWVKERTDAVKPFQPRPEWFEAKAATKDLHPISTISAEACTSQMGVPGPWYERLPHFKMGFTPSSGEEIQSELFVARRDAVKALEAVAALRDRVTPVLHITEVRAIQADKLWMSPAYGQDSIAIHFTWKKDEAGVVAVLPEVEAALKPFEPRPHWGKVSTIPASELQPRYEKLAAFQALRKEFDPADKLRNEYLSRWIGY